MRYTIEAAVRNHIGKIRKNNEDNFFLDGSFLKRSQMDGGGYFAGISSDARQLYAVCDGMGGESNGEEASLLAVERLERLLAVLDSGGKARANIDAFCDETNRSILTFGRSGHMGTTIVLACFHEEGCEIAYLGDSRAYLLRDRKLTRLTHDHTEVNRLKSMGLLSDEEAKNHPDRSMLHKYLGMQYDDLIITPEYVPYTPQAGDRLLLCSDGLTDMLGDDQIEQTLLVSRTATTATKNLINRALEAGGRDNITAMVLCVRKCDDLPQNAPRHGKARFALSKRGMRARRTGGNWYRQDVNTAKEELLSTGKKKPGKGALIGAWVALGVLAAAIVILLASGGLRAAIDLFRGNVKVENSVEIVDETAIPDVAPAAEEERLAETGSTETAALPQPAPASIEEAASSFVNELIACGAESYLENSVSSQNMIAFALGYAYANPQDFPQFQEDPVELPETAAPSAANAELYNEMKANGGYALTQDEIDGIVQLYADAAVAPDNNYNNAVYDNGVYYVLPEWSETESRIAMQQEVSVDDASGNVTVSFDIYSYVEEEGGSGMAKSGSGVAVLRQSESGRFGLMLISLQTSVSTQE